MNLAKLRTELLYESIQPIHLASYSAGPKAGDFEKVKMNRMFEQKVIEPPRTEQAAPIVFAPKKTERCGFLLPTENSTLFPKVIRSRYRVWTNSSIHLAKPQYSPC